MIEAFKTPASGLALVICRFFCAIFLHISLAGELEQAFAMMKYAMNHPWKFHAWHSAYFVGVMQLLVVLSVEAVNLVILLTN